MLVQAVLFQALLMVLLNCSVTMISNGLSEQIDHILGLIFVVPDIIKDNVQQSVSQAVTLGVVYEKPYRQQAICNI